MAAPAASLGGQSLAAAPESAPLLKESLLFLQRGFRVGRSLEEVTEQTFDALQQSLTQRQQNPPPDPKVQAIQAQAQIDQQTAQAEMQTRQQEAAQEMQMQRETHGLEMQKMQAEMQMEMQKLQAEMQFLMQKLGIEREEMQMDLAAQQQQAAMTSQQNQEKHALGLDMMKQKAKQAPAQRQ